MKKKEITAIKTVPHKERPASLDVEITGIPQWKQDVFNLVAELTKFRLRNRITQKELAERLQVSQSVIARFEKLGRYPTIEFLYKVATGLGMQIEMTTNVIPRIQDTKENNAQSSIMPNSGEFVFYDEGYFNTLAPTIMKKNMQENWITRRNVEICIGKKVYIDTQVDNNYIVLFKCHDTKGLIIDGKQAEMQTEDSHNDSQRLAA